MSVANTVGRDCVLCKAGAGARVVRFPVAGAPPIEADLWPRDGQFLRVARRAPDAVGLGFEFCMVLAAVTSRYNVGKQRYVNLRNLRMEGDVGPLHANGLGFQRLVWCASCGAVDLLMDHHVDQLRPERCETCKAAVSVMACPLQHAYGVCSECTEKVLDDCPFET